MHHRRLSLLLLAGAALAAVGGTGCAGAFRSSRAGQPLAPEAAAYVDTVLALMREHALAERHVDWDSLKRETLYRAGGARDPRETHRALQWALHYVNPHSYLMLPEKWADMERQAHDRPSVPSGQMLAGGVGYIAMPAFVSQDSSLAAEYAVNGQRLIREQSAKGACGWVVDLRRNTGGNMYPMLVAIGPLLGDGPAGFFRAGAGMISGWGYGAGGNAWFGGDTMMRLPRTFAPVPPKEAPVAVLTGPMTASSAEGIVVAFRGVDRAISFGSPTAGFSTGNTGYRLSDGATVLLTELVFGDRLGREYGDKIRPDRSTGSILWNLFADPQDKMTTATAADWVRSRPECRKAKKDRQRVSGSAD